MGLVYLSDGTKRLDQESCDKARGLAVAQLVANHQLEYDTLVNAHMALVLAQEVTANE